MGHGGFACDAAVKLRQLLTILQHHAARAQPDADVLLQIVSESGPFSGATQLEVFFDPNLPDLLVISGREPAPAPATDKALPVSAEIEALVEGYVGALLKRLGSSREPQGGQ